MRSFLTCLTLTFVLCLGMTGCGFKIPTWGELTKSAEPAKTETETPVVQQVVPVEPPKPPEPTADEVIGKFRMLKPREINDAQIQALCNLKERVNEITSIDATGGMVSSAALTNIANLTNLNTLILSGTKIDNGVLAHLAKSPSITALSMNDTTLDGTGLSMLQSMPNLRHLELNGCKLQEGAWEEIGKLQNLEAIGVANTPLTNQGMEAICRVKSLKFFILHTTNVTDEGLVPLQNLENLEHLDLGQCRVTGDGLKFLAQGIGLKNLKALSLAGNTSLSQTGGNLILKLRSLETLNMAGVTGVNDVYLKQLVSSCPSLTLLAISGAGQPQTITDKGIIAVAGAKKLKVLYADGIRTVSDLSLNALTKNKGLEELRIDGECTVLGAQKFKKAHPDCNLIVNKMTY